LPLALVAIDGQAERRAKDQHLLGSYLLRAAAPMPVEAPETTMISSDVTMSYASLWATHVT